jgi:hypothetical protein
VGKTDDFLMNRLVWIAALALTCSAPAAADHNFGIGVKAGTLGIGVEGTWRPPVVPWLDFRVGVNRYDYEDSGDYSGIPYDGSLGLDTYYASANLRFPLSPFRLTAGVYSNGNELELSSTGSGIYEIGGIPYDAADVGTLRSVTSFSGTAPYFGVGFDFTVLSKVGLNLDFGVLWQGDPDVTLTADGILAGDPFFQSALEAERLELVDEVSDYKAWPVVSLGFVFNFL